MIAVAGSLSLGAARVGAVSRVGVRGGGNAVVERAGRVLVGSAALDWWIGADDRWHRPAAEMAVRQRRLQGAPVVETRLRLPGGDAAQRVYGARPRGAGLVGDLVVVEVANESRLPVALALTIGPGAELSQHGAVTRLDGAVALVAPRPPSRIAAAPEEALLFDTVAGGRADEFGQLRHHEAPTGAFLALVWPLAHGATLRMAVPLGSGVGSGPPTTGPLELPGAEQVARGWRWQLEADVGMEVPEPALAEAVLAARSELLLGVGGGEAAVGDPDQHLRIVRSGARWGHEEVVAAATARLAAGVAGAAGPAGATRASGAAGAAGTAGIAGLAGAAGLAGSARLAGAADRADPSGPLEHHAALVGALAEAARLGAAPPAGGPGDGDDRWLSMVAAAVGRLDRALRRPGRHDSARLDRYRSALADAADLLRRWGQPEAADHVGRLHPLPEASPVDAAGEGAGARIALEAALARASPTWTWADPDTGPEFLLAARGLLLDDRPTGGVALLPGWPGPWWGAPVSFHRLPARWGRVSAALRWHGDRPALLWEIDRSARPEGSDRAPTVRAPALDPGWAATGWQGEALLGRVPPAAQQPGEDDPAGDGSFS